MTPRRWILLLGIVAASAAAGMAAIAVVRFVDETEEVE